MKIIHISDLHYNKTGNRTEKLVEKIIQHYKPDNTKPLIVNSGDFIENGKRSQMNLCKRHIQKLKDAGFDMLICPGNHDVRKVKGSRRNRDGLYNFNNYFKSFLPNGKNYLGEEDNNLISYPLVHQYDHYFFIGLNSNKRSDFITPGGRLGSSQRDELQDLINGIRDENDNAVIVVYLHHHPFKYNINIRNLIFYKHMKLSDRKKFLEIINGKIDVLLFGHAHWDERLTEKESKYGIKLVQLSAESTHTSDVFFNEIDLTNFYIQKI